MQTFMEGEKIEVIVGEAAKIDVGQAITYIKSGQAEIGEAVSAGKSEITSHANTKIGEFDANASAKTTAFDSNASSKTSAFNSNYTSKLDDFNSNASSKTSVFNTNATNKTTAFDSNAADKTTAFNNNATSKTTDFNDNYTAKKAVIDGAVSDAQGYATTAKQYAIGEPSEPVGNSAKYWAQQASSSVSGLETRVTSIEGKIPSSATSGNQLTDKSYVDTADNNLQQQIDAITASSDVTDIVGTYAQLQAYDTSALPNNSIIKVLQDESRDDETTYYRWVITGGVGAWVLIGEEGPYYTIAAADAKFQDALVSGTNIKTINGNSVLGSGNLYVGGLPSQTGNSGKYLTTDGTDASWDNVKLVENAQDENTLGIWQGTEQEWEQAEITDWRKWQTDGIVGAGTGYTGEYIKALCYDGEKFCGIKLSSGPQHWMTSTDGVTWTDVGAMDTSFLGTGDACQLTYNNGKYFGASTTYVYSSTDGVTWTQCCATSYPREIFTNGNLVIVPKRGTSYDYSTDNGTTWQTGTWPVDPGSFSTPCVAYNGTTYIAVSRDYIYKSTDALTWTYQAAPTTGDAYVKVKYGNGRFVAQMGNSSYYSTDGGTTWTQGDIISPAYALLYADGVFFAMTQSYSTRLISSIDGDDWAYIAPTNLEYITWYFAAYGNGKIIATGGSQGNLVVFPVSSSSCYTTTTTPTTESTVYSAPNTTSALTITSVGTGTITLSDNQVYNRQAGGDTQTYQDVASLYPNHLAFVDNVGVKIGNTLIANSTDTTEIEQDIENLESGKADKDLVNTGYITNCITQISQDINIELSNGTLTLKKGSKVYVPNGTGVFDEVTVASDCQTSTSTDNTWLVFYKNGSIQIRNVNVCTSGTSQPSGNYKAGYNTSTNKVSLTDGSGTLTTDYSLPVAVVTSSDGALTSIDKVFNGFGYIGSTIFSLPGIKALIPMGRNEDGSMINREITTTSVLTKTETTTGARRIMLGSSTLDNYVNVYYNEDKNILLNSTNSMIQRVDCGSFYRGTDGTITLFASKNPLNILGYSDHATIAGWAMPSSKYIDLTLGANNAYYTVPADGYVFVSKNGAGSGQYVNVYVVPSGSTERIVGFTKYDVSSNGIVLAGTVPVSKGQRFTVIYNASGATNYFRFVYANGSAWEKA